jgi:hypothetical protein
MLDNVWTLVTPLSHDDPENDPETQDGHPEPSTVRSQIRRRLRRYYFASKIEIDGGQMRIDAACRRGGADFDGVDIHQLYFELGAEGIAVVGVARSQIARLG